MLFEGGVSGLPACQECNALPVIRHVTQIVSLPNPKTLTKHAITYKLYYVTF